MQAEAGFLFAYRGTWSVCAGRSGKGRRTTEGIFKGISKGTTAETAGTEPAGGKQMSEFSNMLEQHILQAGLSEIQLAQATGFSRSYIARLKNGQRISPDTERMTKLFDALSLTAAEYAQLWNLYLEERLGKEQYGLTRKMLSFLSSFRQVSRLGAAVRMEYALPEVSLVEGNADLAYMIRVMIEREAAGQWSAKQEVAGQRETTGQEMTGQRKAAGQEMIGQRENGRKPIGQERSHVRLFLQPECVSAMEALKNGFRMNPGFLAEHIVCLEKEKKTENITLLEKLIPVILSRRRADYRVYYYYDRVSAHLNSFSMMPYFLITGDCVLNMDYELEHGIVYRDPQIRDFFVRRFDRLAGTCRPLYERLTDEKELMAHYLQQKAANQFYCIGNQPCMGFLEAAQRIGRYLPGEMGGAAEALQGRIRSGREDMLRRGCRVTSYFTEEGIRRFIEEGIVEELPDVMMERPLSREDRCRALRELIEQTEQGFYEPHLIQERKYRYPEGVMIDAYDFDDVALYYYAKDMNGCFIMGERSLARLFYEFLEGFKDSAYVCSAAETLTYLKGWLDEEGDAPS